MPLYEYECQSCQHRFERIQKFSDAPLDTCPSCGGQVKRLLSSPAIQFKGNGWYITDYARKGNGSGSSASSSEKGEKKDTGSDTAATTSTSASTGTAS